MWGERIVAILVLSAVLASAQKDPKSSTLVFTMCIPEQYWKECVQMMEDSAKKGIPISCISGRDRYECIEKVGRKEADVVAVDPEDMYLAAKNELAAKNGYNVVEQIRTKEEPDAPYRYEAVAVIHKDLKIDNAQGLRGLKSCHTGVGRNVGYKIPITKLTAMGILTNLNDPEYSARENELRALSTLFSKGCLVGTWSQDPAINLRLKQTYSNMCALCEDPEKCDYPDQYSGYEGALRCLAFNGGEVAWTKVIYVKRFFGLPVGVSPPTTASANPSDFRYFCPDGSKVAIDAYTKPCTWAARPWQGYMTNGGVNQIDAVQKELTELGKLGETEKAAWWKDLMLLDDKTLAVAAPPVLPQQHLTEAKYLDVIERNSGAPERYARWCVWNPSALKKCRALAKAAHSRDIRPQMDCVLEKDEDACLKALRDNGADLVVIEGGSVSHAIKDFNAKPIIAESYGNGSTNFSERPAVAVVRKDEANINKLEDLRGKQSCHSGYKGNFAGWSAPVQKLKDAHLIEKEEDVENFFAGSCVPGAAVDSKLCVQCAGNVDSNDDKLIQATKCQPTKVEAFNGGSGALRCLKSNKGNVAFLPLTAVMKEDGKADKLDLMLLCPSGGKKELSAWNDCNFGLEAPRVIVSSAAKSVNALEELKHGILAVSSLYSKRPDLLQLFGSWGGNLIFKDDAVNLVPVENNWDKWDAWADTQQKIQYSSVPEKKSSQ